MSQHFLTSGQSLMEKLVQTTALQQPKPKPPKRSYASFLEDCVDPDHPRPSQSANTTISKWLESVGSDREKRCRSDSHLRRSDRAPFRGSSRDRRPKWLTLGILMDLPSRRRQLLLRPVRTQPTRTPDRSHRPTSPVPADRLQGASLKTRSTGSAIWL